MNKRKAFTLIELLVVISIIALLMAILMPSLQRARKQAKTVVCQSNLHQWALVFSAYTGDYDGYFMKGWIGVEPGGHDEGRGIWLNATRSYYADSNDIRLCPVASKPYTEGGEPGFGGAWGISRSTAQAALNGLYTSYTINWWVNNPTPLSLTSVVGGKTKYHWRHVDQKGANNIPLLVDGLMWLARPNHTNTPPPYNGCWGWSEGGGMKRVCINRHDGYINGVFMDFSVRKMGLKQLWKFKWHRGFDTLMGPGPGEWPEWMKSFNDY